MAGRLAGRQAGRQEQVRFGCRAEAAWPVVVVGVATHTRCAALCSITVIDRAFRGRSGARNGRCATQRQAAHLPTGTAESSHLREEITGNGVARLTFVFKDKGSRASDGSATASGGRVRLEIAHIARGARGEVVPDGGEGWRSVFDVCRTLRAAQRVDWGGGTARRPTAVMSTLILSCD